VAAGRLVGLRGPAAAGAVVETVELRPGSLAAWLVVAGVPVADLPPGARLRIGGDAVLELLASDAGASEGGVEEQGAGALPARVIAGGRVRAGDAVQLEAVALPPGDVLDLHAFRPADVPGVVAAYLDEARAAGLHEVRLVHGRGRGVQRAVVQRLLRAMPHVVAFADAVPDRGGWGATVVRLAPAPGQPDP
jgi:hypothetical protein